MSITTADAPPSTGHMHGAWMQKIRKGLYPKAIGAARTCLPVVEERDEEGRAEHRQEALQGAGALREVNLHRYLRDAYIGRIVPVTYRRPILNPSENTRHNSSRYLWQ